MENYKGPDLKKVSSTELNISGAREDQVTDRARPDQLLVRVSGPIVHQEPSVPGRESQEGRRKEEKVRKNRIRVTFDLC